MFDRYFQRNILLLFVYPQLANFFLCLDSPFQTCNGNAGSAQSTTFPGNETESKTGTADNVAPSDDQVTANDSDDNDDDEADDDDDDEENNDSDVTAKGSSPSTNVDISKPITK